MPEVPSPRQQDEMQRLALEAADAGVWTYDARTDEVTWDDRFSAHYGFPAGQPRSFDAWVARIHQDDRSGVLARIAEVRRTPGDDIWNIQFRAVRPDGAVVRMNGVGRAERDADGTVTRLIGLNLDVTARQDVAEALRESRDREHDTANVVRLLLQTAAQGIVYVDAQGVIQMVNAALETMFGWSAGELVGHSIEALLPASLRHQHVEHRTSFFATPRPRPMGLGLDLVGQRKDGSTFPVEVSLNHVATPAGARAVGFVTDITHRKAAEHALRDHARLASLRADLGHILASPGPLDVVLQDAAAALVTHLEVAFFRIWSLNDAEDTLELQASAGLYTHRNGPHARVPVGEFKIGRIAQRRAPHLTNDVLHDPEISDVAWARREGMVAFAGYPLLVEGRVVGVMATFARHALEPLVLRDLSAIADVVAQCIQRKRAEVTLRARTAELERRTEQLGLLASELTVAEQQAREQLAKTLHDGLQQVLFSGRLKVDRIRARLAKGVDATDLVDSLQHELDDAIGQARSLAVELFPPMLHAEGLAAGLRWLAEWAQQKYRLTVELTADPAADPGRRDVRILVFESVRELVFNVVKHAKVDRVALDLTRTPDGVVRITVADRGVGFDPAVALDPAHPHRAGLGLFSVRERLALLGGALDVRSAPGTGTTFTLTAPPAHGHERLATTGGPTPMSDAQGLTPTGNGASARPLTILIADDHALVRDGLRELFADHAGLQVVGEAADGVQAVAQARALRPDVIVMDVSMPHMDGVEATRRIRAELPFVKVFGLSTEERLEGRHAIEAAGAAGYFTKSDDAQQLLARLLAVQADGQPSS